MYGRCIGGPAARIISPLPRYRIPVPVLAGITDRVHCLCESRTRLSAQPGPSSSAVVIIFSYWSRPSGFHVCSMFARMSRYHAVAPCGCRKPCHPMRPGNIHGSARRGGPSAEYAYRSFLRMDGRARQAGSAAAPGAADAGCSVYRPGGQYPCPDLLIFIVYMSATMVAGFPANSACRYEHAPLAA